MRHIYYNLAKSLWHKHETTPLSANEVALYLFLLDFGYKSGWCMPIRLHNSEVCPMLMEKSALEKARKKLRDNGLIAYTASRSPRHLPTYTIIGCETDGGANKSVSKAERIMVESLASLWQAFDERALSASEAALYACLLHEAERNYWQMPVRVKDYMPLTLLLKQSALNDARNELAARNLITFDVGDGKRDVPRYILVGMDSIAASSKSVTSKGMSKPKPKTEKKPDEFAVEAMADVNAEIQTEADISVAADMLPKAEVNMDEAQDRSVIEAKVYPTPEQTPSFIDTADKDASENDSNVSTNQSLNHANKPIDMRLCSFSMTDDGKNNESIDEYDFWD